LNPYTVDKSRPVDPVTLHIVSVVNRVAAELDLPYIVVGATARDLLLFHVFGMPVTRATADVDFAVAMDSWDRFRELRAALLTRAL
jgi:predicted nucleotidyltransferase